MTRHPNEAHQKRGCSGGVIGVVASVPDPWCQECGCQDTVRDSVVRRLAHEPLGWRLTVVEITIRRPGCPPTVSPASPRNDSSGKEPPRPNCSSAATTGPSASSTRSSDTGPFSRHSGRNDTTATPAERSAWGRGRVRSQTRTALALAWQGRAARRTRSQHPLELSTRY